VSRQYFRAPNGRFASPAKFEWALRAETGAYRPRLTVEPSRPDIPTLTDAVPEPPMPFWWRWWLFLSGQA